MEYVPTTDQKISSKVWEAINKEILLHTCQLFRKNSTYEPIKPEGSGVFVKLGDSHYIFTASHVVEFLMGVKDQNSPMLYVRAIDKNKYVNVPLESVGTELKKKGEGADIADLAYIKLNDEFLAQINRHYKFIDVSKIRQHRKLIQASHYCALGFPEINVWTDDERSLITKANVYIMEPSKDEYYDHYGFDRKTTILLDVKGKGKDLIDPTKTNKIEPTREFHGISGGGLWFLIIYHNEEGELAVDYKLIGIVTEYTPGSKYLCMVANRADILLYKLRVTENYKFREIPRYFGQPIEEPNNIIS